MPDITHHITKDEVGQTLAALVRRWSPELSWTEARGVVERRRVSINGNLCLDPARRLTEAEVVKISAHAQKKPTGRTNGSRFSQRWMKCCPKPSLVRNGSANMENEKASEAACQ
jgi:ribosomal protein S4